MYGFRAISANNGWITALLGISLVFLGLAFLCFFIKQLHNILTILDKKNYYINLILENFKKRDKKKIIIPENLIEIERVIKLLIDEIGEPFSLPTLIRTADKRGLDKPHSSINALIEAEIIISDGKGYFIWKA